MITSRMLLSITVMKGLHSYQIIPTQPFYMKTDEKMHIQFHEDFGFSLIKKISVWFETNQSIME